MVYNNQKTGSVEVSDKLTQYNNNNYKLINARDIDWEGAVIKEGTVIDTSESLLSYISTLGSYTQGTGDEEQTIIYQKVKVLILYTSNNGSSTPALPTNVTYNFATEQLSNNGNWVTDKSTLTGDVVWMTMGTAYEETQTQAITWSAPVRLTPEKSTTEYVQVQLETIYKKSATQPAKPTGGSYDFVKKQLTPPNGWTNSSDDIEFNIYEIDNTKPIIGLTVLSSYKNGGGYNEYRCRVTDKNNISFYAGTGACYSYFSGLKVAEYGDYYVLSTTSDPQQLYQYGILCNTECGVHIFNTIDDGIDSIDILIDDSAGCTDQYGNQFLSAVKTRIPSSNDVTWSSMRAFYSDNTSSEWSTPLNQTGKITEIFNMVKTYVAAVYKESDTTPTAPTGGSYNFDAKVLTAPTGWSATPISSEKAYCSIKSFHSDGTGSAWSTPVLVATANIDITALNYSLLALKILLEGNTISLLAQEIDIDTLDLNVIAEKITQRTDFYDLVAGEISMTALAAQIDASKITITADSQLKAIAKNIDITANNFILTVASNTTLHTGTYNLLSKDNVFITSVAGSVNVSGQLNTEDVNIGAGSCFFDGTGDDAGRGWVANGHIKWDSDGNITLDNAKLTGIYNTNRIVVNAANWDKYMISTENLVTGTYDANGDTVTYSTSVFQLNEVKNQGAGVGVDDSHVAVGNRGFVLNMQEVDGVVEIQSLPDKVLNAVGTTDYVFVYLPFMIGHTCDKLGVKPVVKTTSGYTIADDSTFRTFIGKKITLINNTNRRIVIAHNPLMLKQGSVEGVEGTDGNIHVTTTMLDTLPYSYQEWGDNLSLPYMTADGKVSGMHSLIYPNGVFYGEFISGASICNGAVVGIKTSGVPNRPYVSVTVCVDASRVNSVAWNDLVICNCYFWKYSTSTDDILTYTYQ